MVLHATKSLINQLGTTDPYIGVFTPTKPAQKVNPRPSDHDSLTIFVPPPSENIPGRTFQALEIFICVCM